MAHWQGESVQTAWLRRRKTFLCEISTVMVRSPWSAKDPRLPFAQGRLLFIYVDANAARRSSVHLQWAVSWIRYMGLRTIQALPIPFETAEPIANCMCEGRFLNRNVYHP
jgi:hypothetical protein